VAGGARISRGWEFFYLDRHDLTYMIDIALTTEFSLTIGGAR
jgi:hypothetical protein